MSFLDMFCPHSLLGENFLRSHFSRVESMQRKVHIWCSNFNRFNFKPRILTAYETLQSSLFEKYNDLVFSYKSTNIYTLLTNSPILVSLPTQVTSYDSSICQYNLRLQVSLNTICNTPITAQLWTVTWNSYEEQ